MGQSELSLNVKIFAIISYP